MFFSSYTTVLLATRRSVVCTSFGSRNATFFKSMRSAVRTPSGFRYATVVSTFGQSAVCKQSGFRYAMVLSTSRRMHAIWFPLRDGPVVVQAQCRMYAIRFALLNGFLTSIVVPNVRNFFAFAKVCSRSMRSVVDTPSGFPCAKVLSTSRRIACYLVPATRRFCRRTSAVPFARNAVLLRDGFCDVEA